MKHREIQENIINHPEKLPESRYAKLGSFGFTNIIADLYWLQTVQYIGGNIIGEEYKKYLFAMMDLITELNPFFESPYTIGQLLLPGVNYDENDPNSIQARNLGIKWVKNLCNPKKVASIIQEEDLEKILFEERYKDPCEWYQVPYYLAYTYYFYLNDPEKASDYYKVVSAQSDAPRGIRIMSAIMRWKAGEREKSIAMFLSLGRSVAENDERCLAAINELEKNISVPLYNKNISLNWELIKTLQTFQSEVIPEITKENENEIVGSTSCINYVGKALREIYLIYIEEADTKYISDNPWKVSSLTPVTLLQEWYIDLIPNDYQNIPGEEYTTVYKYDERLWRFDSRTGNYVFE